MTSRTGTTDALPYPTLDLNDRRQRRKFTVISIIIFFTMVLLAVVVASGVILTAGYILWAIQRVYLGPVYKGPHAEEITPINGREAAIAWTLLIFAIVLGVYPESMFGMMRESMALLVENLDQGYQNWHQAAETARAAIGR